MDIWSRILKENKIGLATATRLQMIEDMRWSGKARALTRIYGALREQSSALHVNIAKCHHFIASDATQKSSTIEESAKLLQHDVILTAMTFLRAFRHTTPLSDYLQTSKMDYAQAWTQVEYVFDQLKNESRDFETVKDVTDEFVGNKRSTMASEDDLQEIAIEKGFQKDRDV